MAKAKKLPSGSWRVQVFDRFEPVLNPDGSPIIENGKPKKKYIIDPSLIVRGSCRNMDE